MFTVPLYEANYFAAKLKGVINTNPNRNRFFFYILNVYFYTVYTNLYSSFYMTNALGTHLPAI